MLVGNLGSQCEVVEVRSTAFPDERAADHCALIPPVCTPQAISHGIGRDAALRTYMQQHTNLVPCRSCAQSPSAGRHTGGAPPVGGRAARSRWRRAGAAAAVVAAACRLARHAHCSPHMDLLTEPGCLATSPPTLQVWHSRACGNRIQPACTAAKVASATAVSCSGDTPLHLAT